MKQGNSLSLAIFNGNAAYHLANRIEENCPKEVIDVTYLTEDDHHSITIKSKINGDFKKALAVAGIQIVEALGDYFIHLTHTDNKTTSTFLVNGLMMDAGSEHILKHPLRTKLKVLKEFIKGYTFSLRIYAERNIGGFGEGVYIYNSSRVSDTSLDHAIEFFNHNQEDKVAHTAGNTQTGQDVFQPIDDSPKMPDVYNLSEDDANIINALITLMHQDHLSVGYIYSDSAYESMMYGSDARMMAIRDAIELADAFANDKLTAYLEAYSMIPEDEEKTKYRIEYEKDSNEFVLNNLSLPEADPNNLKLIPR